MPAKEGSPWGTAIPPFRITVTSGKLAVREALTAFIGKLEPLDLDIEEVGTIELILAEVLNNIVEHAYPSGSPEGPIDIDCSQIATGLSVQIRDRGAPMPERQLPIGIMNAVDVGLDDMPEGGFGWFLIRHLAKDVTYTRENEENLLSMRLAIGVAPQALS